MFMLMEMNLVWTQSDGHAVNNLFLAVYFFIATCLMTKCL